jgi:predicted small integral membrane protein
MPVRNAWATATSRQRRFMLMFVGVDMDVAEMWMRRQWNELDKSVRVAIMRHWRHNPSLVPEAVR